MRIHLTRALFSGGKAKGNRCRRHCHGVEFRGGQRRLGSPSRHREAPLHVADLTFGMTSAAAAEVEGRRDIWSRSSWLSLWLSLIAAALAAVTCVKVVTQL